MKKIIFGVGVVVVSILFWFGGEKKDNIDFNKSFTNTKIENTKIIFEKDLVVEEFVEQGEGTIDINSIDILLVDIDDESDDNLEIEISNINFK
ncbi:MAG TPA: hypothetical protein EYG72_00840 [Candidatus Pacebacteria bacterium]|nr:hypothetical protein [Candidatus Paceibacterota bacterium]